ncbi:MAG: hypothetical protein R3D29_11890 [Nitratireductor sp.]
MNGSPLGGAYASRLQGSDLVSNPLSVSNRTSDPLPAGCDNACLRRVTLHLRSNGFEVESAPSTKSDGTEADMNAVRQDGVSVVLEINELNSWHFADSRQRPVAGGFEIDNPRLVKECGT